MVRFFDIVLEVFEAFQFTQYLYHLYPNEMYYNLHMLAGVLKSSLFRGFKAFACSKLDTLDVLDIQIPNDFSRTKHVFEL